MYTSHWSAVSSWCFQIIHLFLQVLLYPEGTRFTESKYKASMEFAKENGYPLLKYDLLPRTKGFVQIIRTVKGKSKEY